MSEQILLPKIGFSMNEARFVEWLVEDGATVEKGEPLFAIESEKAVEEVPAAASGRVRHAAKPDEDYEVGAVLGTIE